MKTPVAGRVLLLGLLVAILCGATGCGLPELIAYPFAPRDAKKEVKKDYDLTAQRLLILPYAGPDVLFDYEGADVAVSDYIIQEILKNLRGRVHAVIRPTEVTRYQQTNLDWPNVSVQKIGKEFQADKVLYIEISRLTLMEDRSANLYRGRISAKVQVIDVQDEHNDGVAYSTDIAIEYPPDRPVGAMDTTRNSVQVATLYTFAETLVRKFYDHEEKVFGVNK